MPDRSPAEWRNALTSEVLSAGNALPVGDVLHSFPVALLMSEGKERVCANRLNGARPTVFPGVAADCRESTRIRMAIIV